MGVIRWAVLSVVILGLAAPAQELKRDGILKSKGGDVAAALAFAPGDRVVVAYVAHGTEGKKEKLTNWVEVRLLDVASGKHRVLARAETPDELPGIPANYTLVGFTSDGKKVAVSTVEPGGTTKKLLVDIPEFKEEKEGNTEKRKAEDSKK